MKILAEDAFEWIRGNKLQFAISLLLVLAIIVAGFNLYPRTTLVMGVNSEFVNADGKPKNANGPIAKITAHLAAQGITLRLKSQPDRETEKSTLQFLLEEPAVDFVIARNSGAELSEEVYERFSSLGVISNSPLLFLEKAGKPRIKRIKELRGKKIAFRVAPEGNEKPAFTTKDARVSPYSNNYIIQSFFDLAGITPDNTTLINVWPGEVTETGDWDVYITFGIPSETNSSQQIYPAILKGRIDFLQFEDLEAIAKKMPHLSVQRLPASSMVPAEGVPNSDVRYLATTSSVLAKSDLDPTLVMILAEVLDKVYSPASLTRAKDEFPNFRSYETFKPNPVAEEYYRSGRPLLGKYFPLVIAGLITNLLVVVIPVLTVVWPVAHFFPSIYRSYVKRKVAPWYKRLEFIERNCDVESEAMRDDLKRQLQEVEKGLQAISLPLMYGVYVQDLFHARSHVELVKSKLYRATRESERLVAT